ncbi:MAG TPA: hypothetical protein VHI98_07785 [Vicinamibacterales bacterium]|nr:hypothetical protein [Vicinamibacterales bacterium]
MRDTGREACFALESGACIRIGRGVSDQLQGHWAAQAGVEGSPHLTHTAGPNVGGDFVRTEPRARG